MGFAWRLLRSGAAEEWQTWTGLGTRLGRILRIARADGGEHTLILIARRFWRVENKTFLANLPYIDPGD